jgi:hypothetical protein
MKVVDRSRCLGRKRQLSGIAQVPKAAFRMPGETQCHFYRQVRPDLSHTT